MSERLSDFFEDALRRHFGSGAESSPEIRRADVDKLLSDDGPRRVALGRLAALEWGGCEAAGSVTITSERLLIMHQGLVYLAGLTARNSLPGSRRSGNPGPLRELLYRRHCWPRSSTTAARPRTTLPLAARHKPSPPSRRTSSAHALLHTAMTRLRIAGCLRGCRQTGSAPP